MIFLISILFHISYRDIIDRFLPHIECVKYFAFFIPFFRYAFEYQWKFGRNFFTLSPFVLICLLMTSLVPKRAFLFPSPARESFKTAKKKERKKVEVEEEAFSSDRVSFFLRTYVGLLCIPSRVYIFWYYAVSGEELSWAKLVARSKAKPWYCWRGFLSLSHSHFLRHRLALAFPSLSLSLSPSL